MIVFIGYMNGRNFQMKKSIKKSLTLILAVVVIIASFAGIAAFAADADSTEASESNVQRDIYFVIDIGTVNDKHLSREKTDSKAIGKKLLTDDPTGHNRIALVSFNGSATTYEFTDDYDTLAAEIDALKNGGSSNISAAFSAVKANDQTYGNPAASKHIVIFSDGKITAGPQSSSGKYSAKDDIINYKYYNQAYKDAIALWPDFNIYTVAETVCDWLNPCKLRVQFLKDIQNRLFQPEFDLDSLYKAIIGPKNKSDVPTSGKDTPTVKPTVNPTEPSSAKPTEPSSAKPTEPSSNVKPSEEDSSNTKPTAAPVTNNNNNNNNGKSNGGGSIPQTGSIAAVSAAIISIVGCAIYVGTRKHEK